LLELLNKVWDLVI